MLAHAGETRPPLAPKQEKDPDTNLREIEETIDTTLESLTRTMRELNKLRNPVVCQNAANSDHAQGGDRSFVVADDLAKMQATVDELETLLASLSTSLSSAEQISNT